MLQPGQKRLSETEPPVANAKRPALAQPGGPGSNGPSARDISRKIIQQARETTSKASHTEEGHQEMLIKMKFIGKEVDMALGNFVTRHRDAQRFQFLDVCCAPGGFSEYVVASLPNARGFGLSLPPTQGGHIMKLDMEKYGSRYAFHYMDVPKDAQAIYMHSLYDPARSLQDCLDLKGTAGAGPAAAANCDLLIIDGSFLGNKKHVTSHLYTMTDSENPAFNVYQGEGAGHKALLVAQLMVVGANLKTGGTLMLRLDINSPDNFLDSSICLLRRVFDGTIVNYKPRSCHQIRGSYHVVCNGFNRATAASIKFVDNLGAALAKLRSKGPEPAVVPFPQFPEGHPTFRVNWGKALDAFLSPIRTFRKLHIMAGNEADSLRNSPLIGHLPKTMFATGICEDRFVFGRPCSWTPCEKAHSYRELSAKVLLAWGVRPGVMSRSGMLSSVGAPPAQLSEDEAVNAALACELQGIEERRKQWTAAGVDVTHLHDSGWVVKGGDLADALTANGAVRWCSVKDVLHLGPALGPPAALEDPALAPPADGEEAGSGTAPVARVPPPPTLPADASAAAFQEWWACAVAWFQLQPEELREAWVDHVTQGLPPGFKEHMEAGGAGGGAWADEAAGGAAVGRTELLSSAQGGAGVGVGGLLRLPAGRATPGAGFAGEARRSPGYTGPLAR